jgi:hypothetical protein
MATRTIRMMKRKQTGMAMRTPVDEGKVKDETDNKRVSGLPWRSIAIYQA